MTWAEYIAWWTPDHLACATVASINVFIAYHIGRYVGRKERK